MLTCFLRIKHPKTSPLWLLSVSSSSCLLLCVSQRPGYALTCTGVWRTTATTRGKLSVEVQVQVQVSRSCGCNPRVAEERGRNMLWLFQRLMSGAKLSTLSYPCTGEKSVRKDRRSGGAFKSQLTLNKNHDIYDHNKAYLLISKQKKV